MPRPKLRTDGYYVDLYVDHAHKLQVLSIVLSVKHEDFSH